MVPRQPTVSCKLGLNQQLSYRCVIKLQHKIPANLRSEALGLAMIRLLRCSSISSHSLYNHGHCSLKVADLTVHCLSQKSVLLPISLSVPCTKESLVLGPTSYRSGRSHACCGVLRFETTLFMEVVRTMTILNYL